ncbi:MAG: response regulator [Thauera sp.]
MKILVVDDNPINRLLPVAWLNRNGCTAEECADGREALARMHEGRFDAVLLDLSMPGMSGMEVCSQLRQLPGGAALRVVAYTAHAMPEAIEGFKAAGFDDVLIKPITREKLMRALALE